MFEAEDAVVATEEIVRADRQSILRVGERATITAVYGGLEHQIVDVEIPGRLPMIDIVCFDDKSPLKRSQNTTENEK